MKRNASKAQLAAYDRLDTEISAYAIGGAVVGAVAGLALGSTACTKGVDTGSPWLCGTDGSGNGYFYLLTAAGLLGGIFLGRSRAT